MAKKQPSRKGSKAWRKNVDVKDIQDGIDEKATREILGLDDPKTDLFVIDTLGSESLQKEAKKLKIDQEFELKSKVGAVVQKQRKNTTKPVFIGFKTRNVSINNLNQILKGAKKMKMEGVQIGDHLKKRKQAKQERIADAKKSRGGYDIWGDTATTTTPVSKRPRKGLDLQSTILPGFSYQPTEMDHQDLLRIATDVELKTIESISKVEESLSYPPELDLLSGDNTFVEDDEETDTEPIEINPKFVVKPTKPKSKVDLNRKKRAAQKMLEEKQLSQQKKIAKDINKLKEIQKDLDAKKQLEASNKHQREEKLALESKLPKKFGRYMHQPANIPVQLSDEIASTLRTLKPEGNLVREHFKLYEARNIIEARVPVKRKNRNVVKMIESHDYKRFK